MHQLLRIGMTVQAETSGKSCQVEQFLGGGGQGEVYRANLEGQALALKWYFRAQATPEQQQNLQTLIDRGAPDSRFLWPMTLATAAKVPGFGYLMPLREERYKSIVDLMKRRIEPSFRTLATAGFQLADSFLQLHAAGLCYRDISFGNVFFDPTTGDVLVCDNDNVNVDGQAGNIGGTIGFMAPEVVRGEAQPSTQTDLFSLAVLLFYMFMVHHPLEGKKEAEIRCFDWPAKVKLYGTEPLFIFDPEDESNRPVPGYHNNPLDFWPIYPEFLQNLFSKAFTDGLHDPLHGRIRESEWRAAMIRLRNGILYCSHCGAENFHDVDKMKTFNGPLGTCWSCQENLRLPPRLYVGDQIVMLNHDTRLFPHHVDLQRLYDFSEAVAAIVRHPVNPQRWGLQNLSTQKWVMVTTEGVIKDVEPGRSVALMTGTRINFGGTEGEIRI